MKKYEEYYVNGFDKIDITESKSREKLNSILLDLLENNIKENFLLKQKYPGSYDLRPSVIDYDDSFMEILKEINVNKILREATLKDLYLFHIQVRVVDSSNSYMDWHRDTYYYNNKKSGNFPPGHKIIYYPNFGLNHRKRLKILAGSNKTMFYDQKNDYQLLNYLPTAIIYDSDDEMLLFDVASMHGVIPEEEGEKSIRVIYNFLTKEQILDSLSDDELHMRTMKEYETLFKEETNE
jgi:hypothetical protein